ncbi:hypothetical protein ALC53_08836 [Atta colombica]|uniref:Uncharacterized protein n=1 Tax=Atta colombica TaxID=520822 RepID=A0A195B8V6_9HYME|nr:hypothetical protein ALC53_08836 [Atta colombica]
MTSSSRRTVDDGRGRRCDVSVNATTAVATDATDSTPSLRGEYSQSKHEARVLQKRSIEIRGDGGGGGVGRRGEKRSGARRGLANTRACGTSDTECRRGPKKEQEPWSSGAGERPRATCLPQVSSRIPTGLRNNRARVISGTARV